MAPHRGRKRGSPERVLGVLGGVFAAVAIGGCLAFARGCGSWWATVGVGKQAQQQHDVLSAASRHTLSGDSPWSPLHTQPGYAGPMGAIGMVVWIPLTVWIFLGVAIVADEYFTPALEKISEALDLSADVAGATFLAAASSAPEFFTSFADTFLVSDGGGEGFGIGTIVGSAVFNILIICAVSCIPASGEAKRSTPSGQLLAKSDFIAAGFTAGEWGDAAHTEKSGPSALDLDWYPLARDTVFYVLSIVVLVATVATDEPEEEYRIPLKSIGCVRWYESLVYVLLYASYILCMKFSSKIEAKSRVIKDKIFGTNESGQFPDRDSVPRKSSVQRLGDSGSSHPPGRRSLPKLPFGSGAALMRRASDPPQVVVGAGGGEMQPVAGDAAAEGRDGGDVVEEAPEGSQQQAGRQKDTDNAAAANRVRLDVHNCGEASESDDEDDTSPFWESTFDVPDSGVAKFFWALSLPYNILFRLTIPTVTRANVKQHYILAFVMCILWIALLSAMMVKVVSWMGSILKIDSVVMGLVVLAAGTSVPDALGSYNEAKRGEANAAVSNALGSNVFDICAGLGVPWLVYSLSSGRCFKVPKSNILIPALILFFVLFLFLGILMKTGMRLYALVGKIFVGVYLTFVLWNVLNEFLFGVTM